ncbi:MAG: hypothetical protein M1816_003223 [Peltula sp. TS41687]|nr:MAG: hypothetical protein M1816_003223 [Peltula sp. TS41687]
MVLAKSKNTVGLGNALMHDRFGEGRGADQRKGSAGVRRTGRNGESYVTDGPKEANWVKMRSITEQAALDEFLSTAELAGTDFTAEKLNNVKIIHPDQRNPYLLSAGEERSAVQKHDANRDKLTVPRRPPWNDKMTKEQLDATERESFLQWRRDLAELQESNELLMTPFERNLEVWRQLWRVLERSDLVVQIVDARNPLLFRSEDLEKYVTAVDSRKKNLLLVNKADMMTLEQRRAWAKYFKKQNINFQFFSASMAKERNDAQSMEEERSDEEVDGVAEEMVIANQVDGMSNTLSQSASQESEDNSKKIQVGLVGYPNVGKSSTINALIGAKKVSVSATPGKTKHFQTIHLSPSIILCDCPGLVFPDFATTRAELVCNGILPIDQLREFTGPVGLVCQRIPQSFLEHAYGIKIHVRPLEEGGTGVPTAEELLIAYATARGFTKTGQGQPDESRAARYVLKDYVNGKLLFCHPPPSSNPPIDPHEFNRELYSAAHLPLRRQQPGSGQEVDASIGATDSSRVSLDEPLPFLTQPPIQGEKSSRIDKNFFGPGRGSAGHLTMPFNYKYTEQGATAGKQLSGRKQRAMIALEQGVDPSEVRMMSRDKKHFKGNRKAKAVKEEAVE